MIVILIATAIVIGMLIRTVVMMIIIIIVILISDVYADIDIHIYIWRFLEIGYPQIILNSMGFPKKNVQLLGVPP